jgi:hypothetical protein
MTNDDLQSTEYKPEHLLDELISFLKLKNDAQLSRALKIGPPIISKIRNRICGVTSSILIRMHDVTGLSINALREIGGLNQNNLTPKNEEENV